VTGDVPGLTRGELEALQLERLRATLHAAYAGLCDTVGRTVRVQLPSGDDLTGEAIGVDAEGRLLVRTEHGVTTLGAGDVVHVRPSSPRP